MSERRWRRVLVVRLALAGLAAAGLAIVGADGSAEARHLALLLAGYVVLVMIVEVLRRRGRSRARGLVTPLVLVDGVVLALVVAATGGAAGPLEVLVLLHIGAMALVVSGRIGLEAAIWQATLLLVVTQPTETSTIPPHVAAYLFAGAAIATFAGLEAEADRRHQRALTGQVNLLARLEPVVTAEDACAALADHVVAGGFRRCAVLVVGSDGVIGACVVHNERPALVTAPPPREQGRLLSDTDGPEPVLARFLDPDVDPLLDQLLPGAMNLIGVPIVVDGDALGVAVAEWRPGLRTRIPDAVVQAVRRDAAYCGQALRAVLLLEQVEQRSRRDLLTGLDNRRGFDEALDRELSRVERSGSSMSLALIDLDHFKTVNDTQGHQAGDRVLAAVGAALRRVARTQDSAARIGGDEFALLLPDCSSGDATLVAERVLAAVSATVGKDGVTASVGVSTSPEHGRTRGALVRSADEALYAAKAAGRNRSMTSERRADPATPILVLDGAGRSRPHRRADLESLILLPAVPKT